MSPGPSANDLTRQQLDELDALLQRMLHLPLPTPAPVPVAESTPPPTPIPSDWESALLGPSAALPHGWRLDPAATPPAPAQRPTAEPILAGATNFAAPAPVPTHPAPRVFGGLEAPPAPPPTTGTPNGANPPWASPSIAPRRTPTAAPPQASASSPLRGVDAPALPLGVWEAVNVANAASASARPTTNPSNNPTVAEPDAETDLIPLTPAAVMPPEIAPIPALLWPIFALNWLLELGIGWTGPIGALLLSPMIKHLLGVAGFGLLAGAAVWSARGLGWIAF